MGREKDEAAAKEWRGLLEDCENRPEGMKVGEWCQQSGVSKSNYYYWKKKMKDPSEVGDQKPAIIKIDPDAFKKETDDYLEIECNGVRIRITDRTPMDLLTKVLEVSANA